MLGIKDRLFGSSDVELVDHYAVSATRSGDTVNLNSSVGYDRDATLVLDDEEYTIEDSLSFSVDYLRDENAVLVCVGEVLHNFATERQDETIGLMFDSDQIKNLSEILINDQNVLTDESPYDLDVFNGGGDFFILSLSGFYVNNPIELRVNTSGAYPDINIKNVDAANQTIDLSGMEPRQIRLDCPISLTGETRIKNSKISFETGSVYNLGGSRTLYCEESEIPDRISKWNNTDLDVEICPDNYAPFTTTISEVKDGVMVVVVDEETLRSLGEVTVQYPEWVIGISPSVEYENSDQRSKYSRVEKDGLTRYKIKNVIPNEELKMYHGGGVMRFDPTILHFDAIGENEEREIDVEIDPKKKGLVLQSKREDTVNLIVDGVSTQLSGDRSEIVKVEPKDVTVRVKSTDNELIDSVSIPEEELRTTRRITVVDNSISVE